MIVVDSNVIAYLYVGDAHRSAAQTQAHLDPVWAAPILWRSEFRNTLAGYLRRGLLKLEDIRSLQLEAEDFMADQEYEVDSNSVLDLVSRCDCSAYDCEYVALAKQLGAKLVTADKEVLRAFPEVAVPLPGMG